MATPLEAAFAEARKLSESEQEALAALILEELASERQWNESLARSADALEQLADEAIAEHRAGQTLRLDPESL